MADLTLYALALCGAVALLSRVVAKGLVAYFNR
jgi:hypothetical protein